MTLTDLARAIPGIVAVGLLPGFLLASALMPRWRWWQRLAAAPGLAAGVVGTLGLSLQATHIAFRAQTVLPAIAAICCASGAVWMLRLRRCGDIERTPPPRERVVVAAALLAGLLSAGVAAVTLTASPLPPTNDAAVHGAVAVSIERNQALVTTVPEPADGATLSRPRAAVEGEAVVVSWLGGPSPALGLQPIVLMVIVVLPLGLAWLAQLTTDDWRIATAAPLLALGMPFPHAALDYGELPLLVDSTLVVPLVAMALHSLRRRRDVAVLLTVAAMTLAIWVTHGLELITACLVGGCALGGMVWRMRLRAVRRLMPLAIASAAGAAVGMLLTRLDTVPTAAGTQTTSQAPLFVRALGAPSDVLGTVTAFITFDVVTPVAAVLLVLGVVAARRAVPEARWAVAASGLLVLMLADVGYLGVGARLWALVFPWAVDDRLISMQYWVLPIVMGAGLVAAPRILSTLPTTWWSPIARAGRSLGRHVARAPRLALGLGVTVGLLTVSESVLADHSAYETQARPAEVATTADVRAIAALDTALPAGTIILTNGTGDAGAWIDALSHQTEFAPASYERGHSHDGRPFATSDAAYVLARACADPTAAEEALAAVRAVYVGSQQSPIGAHGWDMRCIAALPGLRRVVDVIDNGHEAAAFVVDPTTRT